MYNGRIIAFLRKYRKSRNAFKNGLMHEFLTNIHYLKNVTTLSRYNSDIHESILVLFRTNVTEKVCKQQYVAYLIFPPQQTSASALIREMQKHKIASFHSNAAYYCIARLQV